MRTNGVGYPAIVINSINLQQMLGFVESGRLELLIEFLLAEIDRLAAAGVDFGLLASNTPHIVFDEIRRRAPIPMISIVESACDAAKARQLSRPGLLGTRSTMQGSFYRDILSRAGITLVIPEPDEQTFVHDMYMSELVNGIFLSETRERLLEIVRRMIARDRIDGLILGGTELPLLLRDEGDTGIPFLDTTRLHVERIVAQLFS